MRDLILLALLGAAVALPRNSQRIVGGSPTNVESYPFMSSIQSAGGTGIVWYHGCGGSLITANSVLSAAHCFFNNPPPWYFRVRLGSSFKSSGGTVYNVRELVLHPQFDDPHNDVAIVRLVSNAIFSASVGVVSIAGPNYNLADGTVVTAAGWGTLSYAGYFPEQLQHVDINIISQSYCVAQYAWLKTQPGFHHWPDVTENMLCAGIQHVGGKDTCSGDSGGPLTHNGNVLVGIISWGHQCALPDFPGVNARVSRYTDWITSNA